MSLRRSYTLIAPFYDAVITAATRRARASSSQWLADKPPMRVLVSGVGTGLDLPHLPPVHDYVGLDLTAAMLHRSRPRAARHNYWPIQGDAMQLPFPDRSFDCAILHLILAVVPDPSRCLLETARVLRPGGQLLIFDKFLKRGETARLRRLLNPLSRRIATRMDVVFEDLLEQAPDLELAWDTPALAGGWFRRLGLHRRNWLPGESGIASDSPAALAPAKKPQHGLATPDSKNREVPQHGRTHRENHQADNQGLTHAGNPLPERRK